MNTRACVIVLLACLTSCVLGATYKWQKITVPSPNPPPRYHHGFTVVNSTGVLVAGFEFHQGAEYLSDTWLYNFNNNTWALVNNDTKPLERAFTSLSTHHDTAVIFAGVGPDYVVYHDVWKFHVDRRNQSKSWTNETFSVNSSIAAILPRQYHASAVIGDKLYVFGGFVYAYGRSANDLLAYDLKNKTWSVVSPDRNSGPLGRQGHTLVSYHDPEWNTTTLLVFGGYSSKSSSPGYSDVWQYVIEKNSWYQVGPPKYFPPGRYAHAAAIINNTLIVFGGMSTNWSPKPEDTYYGDVWALQLSGGGHVSSWTQLVSDTVAGPGKRQGHQAAVYGNAFYTFAGYQQYYGLTNDVWVLRSG